MKKHHLKIVEKFLRKVLKAQFVSQITGYAVNIQRKYFNKKILSYWDVWNFHATAMMVLTSCGLNILEEGIWNHVAGKLSKYFIYWWKGHFGMPGDIYLKWDMEKQKRRESGLPRMKKYIVAESYYFPLLT